MGIKEIVRICIFGMFILGTQQFLLGEEYTEFYRDSKTGDYKVRQKTVKPKKQEKFKNEKTKVFEKNLGEFVRYSTDMGSIFEDKMIKAVVEIITKNKENKNFRIIVTGTEKTINVYLKEHSGVKGPCIIQKHTIIYDSITKKLVIREEDIDLSLVDLTTWEKGLTYESIFENWSIEDVISRFNYSIKNGFPWLDDEILKKWNGKFKQKLSNGDWYDAPK